MAVFDLDRTPIEIQSTKTDQDQKLPLGRLQTPREWNDRVPIEEYCIFNVAIPLKVEFEKKNQELQQQHALGRRSTAKTVFGLSC